MTRKLASVAAKRPSPPMRGIDHIAFAATDYDEFVARFEKHGVRYRATRVPVKDLRQLFVFDPDGIQIEINVRSEPG